MITTYPDLPKIRSRHADERIVFTGGVFDIVHEGHVAGLAYRKSLGDVLVAGIVSDERVRQRKGEHRPIRGEVGRLAVVSAFRAVDYAFIMPMPTEEESPTIQVIKALCPDVFADYQGAISRWEESRELIASLGAQLVYDEGPKLDSTTDILGRAAGIAMLGAASSVF